MIPASVVPASGPTAATAAASPTGAATTGGGPRGSKPGAGAAAAAAEAGASGGETGLGLMQGMVPLIGYDGVPYGYIPAEEVYQQVPELSSSLFIFLGSVTIEAFELIFALFFFDFI